MFSEREGQDTTCDDNELCGNLRGAEESEQTLDLDNFTSFKSFTIPQTGLTSQASGALPTHSRTSPVCFIALRTRVRVGNFRAPTKRLNRARAEGYKKLFLALILGFFSFRASTDQLRHIYIHIRSLGNRCFLIRLVFRSSVTQAISRPTAGPLPDLRRLVSEPERVSSIACAPRTGGVWDITVQNHRLLVLRCLTPR